MLLVLLMVWGIASMAWTLGWGQIRQTSYWVVVCCSKGSRPRSDAVGGGCCWVWVRREGCAIATWHQLIYSAFSVHWGLGGSAAGKR